MEERTRLRICPQAFSGVGLAVRGIFEPRGYEGWFQPPSCVDFRNPFRAQLEDFSIQAAFSSLAPAPYELVFPHISQVMCPFHGIIHRDGEVTPRTSLCSLWCMFIFLLYSWESLLWLSTDVSDIPQRTVSLNSHCASLGQHLAKRLMWGLYK